MFQDLGTLVEVMAKDVAALPWGGAKATWADAATAVVRRSAADDLVAWYRCAWARPPASTSASPST